MFIVTEFTASRPHFYRMNDVKDIRDLVLNITSSEKEADLAYQKVCEMGFGGIVGRCRYVLECVHDGGKGIFE